MDMTPQENKALMALDRLIDTDPAAMTHWQIRLYRQLFAKYVAQVTCVPLAAGEGVGSARWRGGRAFPGYAPPERSILTER